MRAAAIIAGLLFLIGGLPLIAGGDGPAERISSLYLDKLAPGHHRFWFIAGTDGRGGEVKLPVMVAKGESEGPVLLLTAGLHGDELNGIRIIHRLIEELDVKKLSGTVLALPG